jgi:hypothetical protein
MTSTSVVEPLRLPGLWSYLLLAVVTTASGIGGYFLSLSGESADENSVPTEAALDLLPAPRPPTPDLAITVSSPSLRAVFSGSRSGSCCADSYYDSYCHSYYDSYCHSYWDSFDCAERAADCDS